MNQKRQPVLWCRPAVVYYVQFLAAACTLKLVKTLFQPFSTFFLLFKPFSINSGLKSWKTSKNEPLKLFFFSNFCYSSKLVDMQTLVDSLRGYLEFVFFHLIFNKNYWKQKKNKLWPAIGCAQPPKASQNAQQKVILVLSFRSSDPASNYQMKMNDIMNDEN